jgi:Flp pilus assembly protein TadD
MRKLIFVITGIVAVLLAGYAGYRGYRLGKNHHLMSLAHQFLAKSDVRNAVLCAEQVLRSDPRNHDAVQMMAELAEASRSPSAFLWLSRLVELDPGSLDNRIALSRVAILQHDYRTATNTLEGVSREDKNTARYHLAVGTVAGAIGDVGQAETHFQEAVRLEPLNELARLDLALAQFRGTNAMEVSQARNALQSLRYGSTNSAMRCLAMRELIADAMHNKGYADATSLAQQLLQEPKSDFQDRLLQLEVLHASHNSGFQGALNTLQRESGTNEAKASELAEWQMQKTSPGDALAWIKTVPAAIRTNMPVELVEAGCRCYVNDWSGLQAQMEAENWAEMEFMRHAFLSRALREQRLGDSSKAEWELANRMAGSQKEKFVMLLQLVEQWSWQSESEDILWTIERKFPGETWAVSSLGRVLFHGGRTRAILQLYEDELKRSPGNLEAKNNVAFCALLLDAQELKPNDLAREVYLASPNNPSYISTYAFSLYLQGKNQEAFKVIQQIPPANLQDPQIAGYYGILLKATGNREKARVYLNWTSRAHLLPEERALFAQAEVGL